MRLIVGLALLSACTSTETPKKPAARTCDLADYPVEHTLSASVEILRDDRDIPHIYAQNDADLFYASGYQLASDRLFELDTFVRAARGTLSEVRGEDALSDDLTSRTFDFGRYACESLEWMATDRPDDFQLMQAYVAGINARIAEVNAGTAPLPWGFGPGELDYAPEPWEMADLVRVGQRISLGYSSSIEYDILYTLMMRLNANYLDFPVFSPGVDRFIVATEAPSSSERTAQHSAPPPLEWSPEELERLVDGVMDIRRFLRPGDGSNNWAVNPAFTDNGRPYIANDPHSSFHDPNTLYLQHLDSASAGGAFDVVGFSFPGVPGVQLGHNDALAWAATTAFSDQTDLYDVVIEDGIAQLGGEEVPATDREEIISVRQADGSMVDQTYTITDVEGYGVIFPDELLPLPSGMFANGKVMVAWSGFSPTNEVFLFLDLDRARTLDAFEAAVDYQRVGMHNWMGATAEGIRYHTHGLIPDRGPLGSRALAYQVMDGSDPANLWTGDVLDPDLLPALDGSQPYMVSANNDPFGHTADNDPLNDDLYYGSFFGPAFRAERIATELERMIAAGPVTAADMQALQLDNTSSIAELSIPMLVDAASQIDKDEDLAEFRGRDDLQAAVLTLSAWDRKMVRTSPEAALFRAWQGFVSRRTLSSDLSLLFLPVEQASPVTVAKVNLLVHEQQIESILDGRGDYDMLAALDEALAWLQERAEEAGVETIAWGDIHRATIHPTWGDEQFLVADGDESTPNVSPCTFWGDSEPLPTCDAEEGAIFRSVTGFAEDGVPETVFNFLHGNDGDTADWSDGVYDTLPYRRSDVEARTVSSTTLEP